MKKYFNSNETLEMCDVKVTETGGITIATKSFHSAELERLMRGERDMPRLARRALAAAEAGCEPNRRDDMTAVCLRVAER